MMKRNLPSSSLFRKILLAEFPGKTRFFQLPPDTLFWQKAVGLIGCVVAIYFGGGIILFPWFVIGVIYYRVKYPGAEGGL